jgi:pimeloyl-ACP methyl ester carboxylesterase
MGFSEFPRLKVSRGLHLLGSGAYSALGFRWHSFRRGEFQLGYWSLRLDSKLNSKNRDSSLTQALRRWVLVPGFGDSALSWLPVITPLLPFLRSHYDEVIALDFPGYLSFLGKEPAASSFELLRGATLDLLWYLNPTVLVGHSMGGWLASRFCLDSLSDRSQLQPKVRSERRSLEALILAAPAGVFADTTEQEAVLERFRRASTRGESQQVSDVLFAGKTPWWFRFLAEDIKRMLGTREVSTFFDSLQVKDLIDPLSPSLPKNTWLLWGEYDRLISLRNLEAWLSPDGSQNQLQSTFVEGAEPQKQLRALVLAGVGHSLQLEAPLVTAFAIRRILSEKTQNWAGYWAENPYWQLRQRTTSLK